MRRSGHRTKQQARFEDSRIKVLPHRCHELIRDLYRKAQRLEITYGDWEQASGVSLCCLTDAWRRNKNPSLLSFIAAGEALGYTLAWVPTEAKRLTMDLEPYLADSPGPSQDNFPIGELSIEEFIK
jgi:hypothetical protein